MFKTIATLLLLSSLTCLAEDQAYQNPVDKKTYVAPGGWKSYAPADGVKPSSEKVALSGVRLLQSQEDMGARTTAPELASFIKLAQGAASEVFASYDKPAALLVQFTCTPGNHTVEISSQGQVPSELLQAYYDKLGQLKALRVSGEVKFQFGLKIAP